jgi:hypothetical protein
VQHDLFLVDCPARATLALVADSWSAVVFVSPRPLRKPDQAPAPPNYANARATHVLRRLRFLLPLLDFARRSRVHRLHRLAGLELCLARIESPVRITGSSRRPAISSRGETSPLAGLRCSSATFSLATETRLAALVDGVATIRGTDHRWSTVRLYDVIDGRIAADRLLALDQRAFDEIWSACSEMPSHPTPRSDREVRKEVANDADV